MMQPKGIKGEVVIKTKFGDVAADSFSQPWEKLVLDEQWKDSVGMETGPFCYLPDELDIPF